MKPETPIEIKISKYLSFILRHKPQDIGLTMDSNGWVSVNELIAKTTQFDLTTALLKKVVSTDDKQRYMYSDDESLIRANQGHSVGINHNLSPKIPPDTLLHGTAGRFLASILIHGLDKQKRHHVHLSEDMDTAVSVGKRYGKPIVLAIDAKKMMKDGFEFYLSHNHVWLVDSVPKEYLSVHNDYLD